MALLIGNCYSYDYNNLNFEFCVVFYGIGKVFDIKEIVFHKIYQHMILPSLPMYTRDFFHGTCITSWLKKVKFLQQLIVVYCCYLKVISTSKLFFTMFYPLIYDQ